MSSFEHESHDVAWAPQGPSQDTIEIDGPDGNRVRFARGDFEEFYTTSDVRQMRRHLRAGWFLLEERAGREPGRSPSWIETKPQRNVDRAAAEGDAQVRSRDEVVTYVLGSLKAGASGTPVA